MLTTVTLINALAVILIGIAIIFFGYKVFRLLLIAGGFLLGVLIGQNLLTIADPNGKMIAALLIGLVLALIANAIYSFGFVIVAGGLSAAFAYLAITQFGALDVTGVILIIGAGIAGAIITLSFKLEKLIVVIACCVYGYLLVANGILRIVYNDNLPTIQQIPPATMLVLIVLGAILFAFGANYQLERRGRH